MPFVLIDIIVLTISVKVLCIVSTNSIDSIHVSIINSCEIWSGVIKKWFMFKTFLLFNILKHPIAAHIVLMSSRNTKQSTMVCYDSSTEFRDVFVKIHQKFWLLSINNIIKMNVFVTPFKIMDDSSVCKFLFHDKKILKELCYVLFNVNMRVLSYHSCFLVS